VQIYPSIKVKIGWTWVAKCVKNPKAESVWGLWPLAQSSVLQHHPFELNHHFESTFFSYAKKLVF
jgi:hypothetical protein